MNKRPELDTENPPGQIVNPIPQAKYLRDVIQRIEQNEKEWLNYEKSRNCQYPYSEGGPCPERACYMDDQCMVSEPSSVSVTGGQAPSDDETLLRRALRYLEAEVISKHGPRGLEDMVKAGDHPVVADLRKRLTESCNRVKQTY